MERGDFEGKGVPHCKVYGHSAIICAKTAEPIEMPFGLWAGMSPRNHVLDGGPAVLRDLAITTNFGTQFAIICFMGCNFGSMITSDTLFDSRVLGFRGQAIRRRHSRHRVSKRRGHANQFWD